MAARKLIRGTKEIADIFGVGERRVQQLAKEKIIPTIQTKPHYQFDLVLTVKKYIKYLNDKLNGNPTKGETAQNANDAKLKAEADLKRHKADIAELQLKELKGQMHSAEDVEAVTTELVYTVRAMILALPGRLAIDVVKAETSAEASEIIKLECHKILEELASYKYDSEEYQKRVRERQGWSELLDEEDE